MLLKSIRVLFYLSSAVLLPLAGTYLSMVVAAEPSHPMEKLLTKAVTLPSEDVKVVVKHSKFPAGFKTPQRTRPGPGPRYVLRGTLEIKDDGKIQTYHAGEAFWESGIPMMAESTGQEEVEVIAVSSPPRRPRLASKRCSAFSLESTPRREARSKLS